MIYISAGLYAEGRTDYEFLLPLIDRLLQVSSAQLFPGGHELADTRGIDAFSAKCDARAERICAAISAHIDSCDIFIIHADGASDPEDVRRTQIKPGIELARTGFSERPIHLLACVPVREIEAWMLVDTHPFDLILGKKLNLALPPQPETELDPKSILRKIFRNGDARIPLGDAYRFFGENVHIEKLRTLHAFQLFEGELNRALKALGAAYGKSQ